MPEQGNRWGGFMPLETAYGGDPSSFYSAWGQLANAQPKTPFEKMLDFTLNVPRAVNALPGAYQQYIGQPFLQAVDYGADKAKWFFTGEGLAPEQRVTKAGPRKENAPESMSQKQEEAAPPARPTLAETGGFTIPGQLIDYTKGLPQMQPVGAAVPRLKDRAGMLELSRPNLPNSPDFTAARDAMKAASPGEFADQDWTTKNEDMLWYLVPGLLQGLAGGGTVGQALLAAAAGGFSGMGKFKGQQKAEKREFSKEQKEYQRWLVANEANMSQNEFSNALQRANASFGMDSAIAQVGQSDDRLRLAGAQMQQQAAQANAELAYKNAALQYEAQLKNQEQLAPKISGNNLILRDANGGYTVKNTDPTHGLYMNLLSGGALPGSAYTTQNLMANLPLEARASVSPMIAEIQKDPNFIAMTAGMGGDKQADVAVLNQLQSRLMQAAQSGDANARAALVQINQALAKGALMGKLKVE